MVQFPAYVDGKPPVISLHEYDDAEWAQETAVDSTTQGYVAVNMKDQNHIVAKFDQDAAKTLDTIFKSAKKQYVEENKDEILEKAGVRMEKR